MRRGQAFIKSLPSSHFPLLTPRLARAVSGVTGARATLRITPTLDRAHPIDARRAVGAVSVVAALEAGAPVGLAGPCVANHLVATVTILRAIIEADAVDAGATLAVAARGANRSRWRSVRHAGASITDLAVGAVRVARALEVAEAIDAVLDQTTL